jgi:RND family efflux transporter MFP subunit
MKPVHLNKKLILKILMVKKMRKTINKILISFMVIELILSFYSCADAGGNEKKKEEPGSFIYVETEKVQFQPFVSYISLIGYAKANQEADVASDEGGKIKSFVKDKGNYVKEGDVILIVENDVLKANLDAAKAQYDMAEINFKKQEEIYNQKVTSELQYLNAKYERDAAKANYELIKSRYDKTFIKAPFAGIIDLKYIEEGEFAPPGAAIISLVSIDRIKIEAGVPENYVGDIKAGNRVKIVFNDLGGETFDEKISYVGSSINVDNRTFPIEIIINNKDRRIKPELNAVVKVERKNFDKAALVPEDIVSKTDLGNVVFVEENGIAKMRVVKVEGRYDNKAAITEGLKEGDNLVLVGFQNLVDGEKVKVLE